ncbi:hypothetical protein RB213_001857, partial [Colletotrichum asianum]
GSSSSYKFSPWTCWSKGYSFLTQPHSQVARCRKSSNLRLGLELLFFLAHGCTDQSFSCFYPFLGWKILLFTLDSFQTD